MAIFPYYSACSLLVFLLVLSHPLSIAVDNSTAITTRYPPPPLDVNPPSPVAYDYYGGEICVVLATSSTAVVDAPDPGNGQNFSINLPLDVPLKVRQGQRPCTASNYLGGNCLSLVLFTSTSMLPLGRFKAFLGPNATTINYGPLGFVTLDGTNTVIFSETQRNFRLIYRTLEQKESFTVCRNRTSVTGFIFVLGSLQNCQVGSITGFSIPFELNVGYSGLLSEVIGQQLIITTATCDDPESGLFAVLDVRSPTDTTSTIIPPVTVTPVDTPPPPTPSHPSTFLPTDSTATSSSTTPTASIVTTPTVQPTTSPPPGNSIGVTFAAAAVVLLCVVGGIIIVIAIYVKMFRAKKIGNLHLAYVRNVSQKEGKDDADTLVDPGDSHSPVQQGTLEPNSTHIQGMIQGTEEIEMNHTQINLHPSDDENVSSATHSPTDTPITSGQSEPATAEQSKVTATGESEATPEKSELSPNFATNPSGGEIVVDGDSGDGVDPGSVNAGLDSDSIHKLDLSATADKAGSSGGVTRSLSGEEGQVLENVLTESPEQANYNVEASIQFPNDLKKRAYSASHKDTKNPNEKWDTGAQSSKKELQDGHSQGRKSQYIDEEDIPEAVEKATSKINQRPERVSGGSLPVSRKDFKELQDTVHQGLQAMKEFYVKGKKDVVDAVKQQGAAIREKQNEHTAMLNAIANTTTATREDVAEVKNNQEDMRDYQFARELEDDQGQVNEDYGEQTEDCSYRNPHTD